jgi:hypothetical protein
VLVALTLKPYCICSSVSPPCLAVFPSSLTPQPSTTPRDLSLSIVPPNKIPKTHIPNAINAVASFVCIASQPTQTIDGSVDKVDAEKVQQQRPEDKVGKGALVRDALELGLVLGVRLHAQAGREHELADGGAEAGQEGVERLRGSLLVYSSVCVCVWV